LIPTLGSSILSSPANKDYMQTKHHHLFPTLVTQIDDFLTEKECKYIISCFEPKEFSPYPGMQGNAVSSFSYNSCILDTLPKSILIYDKLYAQLNDFTKKLGTVPTSITNSWASVQRKDSYLVPHVHGRSHVSGVLYLKMDEQSSQMAFYNQNPLIDGMEHLEHTEYNYRWYGIKPVIGTLLLFPSWLKHGNVAPSLSDERIIISFNTMPK